MTRLTSQKITCPKCKTTFKIMTEASINTWMDPELIQKVIDDTYYYTCPNCNVNIHFCADILINCPKGMFSISNCDEINKKKEILRKYEIIDENGKILPPRIKGTPLENAETRTPNELLDELRDRLRKE